MPMYWDGSGGDPPASQTLHGWKPTTEWYKQQVLTEPGFVNWQTGATAREQGFGTTRRAALRALARQFGGLPTGYTDEYGDFDPTELALDAANPDSQLNRLKASYANQQQQLSTSLAARGALHSGDYVYGQDQLANQYATNLSDAASTFLGVPGQSGATFYGGINDYATNVAGVEGERQGAIDDALGRLEAEYPATGGDTTANLVADWGTKYGVPVYSAPDGSLYIVGPDGNLTPYTSPDQGGAGPTGGGGDTTGTTTGTTQQYPSGTYTLNGVTYNASTGLPISADPGVQPPQPGAAGPSNISLLPYYYGGGPLGRPQGPGSVAYY